MELDFTEQILARRGLWENIRRKKERIKRGSKEKMRKVGDKGAPTKEQGRKIRGLNRRPKEKIYEIRKRSLNKRFYKKIWRKRR